MLSGHLFPELSQCYLSSQFSPVNVKHDEIIFLKMAIRSCIKVKQGKGFLKHVQTQSAKREEREKYTLSWALSTGADSSPWKTDIELPDSFHLSIDLVYLHQDQLSIAPSPDSKL